jgi:hypothetical protein
VADRPRGRPRIWQDPKGHPLILLHIAREGRPMIEILEQSTKNVVAMRLSGKILHRDYQELIPVVEKRIEEHGGVRCFVEMTEFHGVELRALWDEIKFDVRHAWQIERCAVVGDRAWQAWMTKLAKPIFLKADMRFYEIAERDKAWDWINEGI